MSASAEATRRWRRRNGVPERARIPEGMMYCPVDGCARSDLRAPHGYCGMHHQRWYKHGDPLHQRRPRPAPERFWEKVDVTDGCWLWAGPVRDDGYGRFSVMRKYAPAHRWAYEHLVGPVPDGLELDHLCRVRNCVNPDHLEPVTHSENMRRMWRASR